MSAELAVAKQVKAYGMRVIAETKFNDATMVNVTSDLINAGLTVPAGKIIILPYHEA